MWQEARANDKRIKEIMVDHRKRAERRRAYYESRLGDPQQLIRVIGVSSKVYPNAEQFYYHENIDNLMPWQGNPDIKIDRFDGRSLLDYIPQVSAKRRGGGGYLEASKEEREMADELNFERYHDLIEAERLKVTESERLAEVDEEWTKLLDRHQAKLALLDNQDKATKSSSKGFGFDYGTSKANEEELEEDDDDNEKESQLLKEVDILQYVDDLTDKDKQVLNEMSGKYGIKSYARLLRVAKKDRDDELRALKRQRGDDRPKDRPRSANERRRIRRRNERSGRRNDDQSRYRRRHSPTYEPFRRRNSDSEQSSEEEEEEDGHGNVISDFVIEFGSGISEENAAKLRREEEESALRSQRQNAPAAPVEKKLTPMEKLKMKMRAGLEKQIVLDEKEKRQKEKEKELEHLRDLARNQGLPINTYMRPEPPTRESAKNETNGESKPARYRSPPSPKRDARTSSPQSKAKSRYRSPSLSRAKERYRSPSPSREKTRYRSPSPSRERSRYRLPSESRSPSRRSHKRSPSTDRHSREHSSRKDYHHHRRGRSRSPQKRRYRSPSEDRYDSKRSRSRSYDKRRKRSH